MYNSINGSRWAIGVFSHLTPPAKKHHLFQKRNCLLYRFYTAFPAGLCRFNHLDLLELHIGWGQHRVWRVFWWLLWHVGFILTTPTIAQLYFQKHINNNVCHTQLMRKCFPTGQGPFKIIYRPQLHRQEYDYFEFFAGVGNLTKQARACGFRAARFDILDNQKPKHRKSNFMDLTSASGFACLPWIWSIILHFSWP